MNRDRWTKIEHIVDEALKHNTHRNQNHFISKTCKGDFALYLEVHLWMRAIRDADKKKFME